MLKINFHTLSVFWALAITSITANVFADDISQDPLFLVQATEPKVMLSMSNDHQLFIKAYTDYTDLDNDGLIDTSYVDTIDYFGYFQTNRCYQYSNGQGRFNPRQLANGTNNHSCIYGNTSTRWSGNFLNWATMTRMDIIRKVLYGGLRSRDNKNITILERAFLPNDVHSFAKVFVADDADQMAEFTPYFQKSITMCNVTELNNSDRTFSGKVSTSTYPPLVRIASGEFSRWAATEGTQCTLRGTSRPNTSDDLIVRLRACNNETTDIDCVAYPNSTSKPIGILQENSGGNSKNINFGLITGSYEKNLSGGVLRRNILPLVGNNDFTDEYDENTGIFSYLDSAYSSSERAQYAQGIIQTLDALRIAGWQQSAKKHQNGCNSPGILPSQLSNGRCVDWGNPLSEIYLETLRYFSGKASATPAFNTDDSQHIDGLLTQGWIDPIGNEQWCADLSAITISTGLNSFDTDQLSNDISLDSDTWTNAVGTAEGISGQYLIGNGTTDKNNQCSAKNLDNLSDAEGICPELPTLGGGYDIAGMAYFARTNDLRSDRQEEQLLTTYGISLAQSLPKIDIPVGDRIVSLLPACKARSNTGTAFRDCSLVDLTELEINSDGTKGEFDIVWEDSSWGNDYDLDAVSHISFCVASQCDTNPGSGKINITVELRSIAAGHGINVGFIVAGTSQDQPYLDFVPRDPGGSNFTYTATPANDFTHTETFTAGTSAASQLENPLWYMAKYGSFIESNDLGNPVPDLVEEWDILPEGAPDGIPDGYFQATNPALLQDSLNQVFDSIASRQSSFAAVASNSSSLRTDAQIYQASFDSNDWSGQLLSFPINATTNSIGNELWDAAQLIPDAAKRNIFSYNTESNTPIIFKHNNLGAAQQSLLDEDQVEYLRGDQTNEGASYRPRNSLLGDIVNSNPLFVAQENFNYFSMPGYNDYLLGNTLPWHKSNRQKMLYVGANDGMLHAIIADGNTDSTCDIANQKCEGAEEFTYVPKALYSKLALLTETDYQHQYYVDNSPTYSDAEIAYNGITRWGSVLIGTLGAGGKGIFALDISDPTNFSASDVLWDKDSNDTGLDNLGFTFSKASIIKMANGKWAAIIGNGYANANNKASLFILDLETGDVIREIAAGTQGDATKPNGLSTPIVIDTDNDRIADTVYAGDLYGNLWKFDVSDTSSNNWEVAYKDANTDDKPLFAACNSNTCNSTNLQAITAKPEVVRSRTGEPLILFGTGRYYATDDRETGTQIHSYYGITDAGTPVLSRSELLQQEIITTSIEQADDTVTFIADSRVTTNNAFDYTTHKGWYLDFNDNRYAGERVVSQPITINGLLLFSTIIPDSNACSDGGDSFIMLLDAQTGARPEGNSFDFTGDSLTNADDKVKIDSNGDSKIDGSDTAIAASGISKGNISGNITTVGDLVLTAGGDPTLTDFNRGKSGRVSWTQLK